MVDRDEPQGQGAGDLFAKIETEGSKALEGAYHHLDAMEERYDIHHARGSLAHEIARYEHNTLTPAKLAVLGSLLDDPAFTDMEKAGMAQALFHAPRAERGAYALRFTAALENLREALDPTKVLYFRGSTPAETIIGRHTFQGFFKPLKPGIEVDLEHPSTGGLPKVKVRTAPLQGVLIVDNEGRVSAKPYYLEKGGILYGADTAGKPEPREVLETGTIVIENGAETHHVTRFITNYTEFTGFEAWPDANRVALAIAAEQMGVAVDYTHALGTDVNQDITHAALLAATERAMGRVLAIEEKLAEYEDRPDGSLEVSLSGVAINSLRQHIQAVRLTPALVERHIKETIETLHHDIIQGRVLATELPYVQVGRERLSVFLKQLFDL